MTKAAPRHGANFDAEMSAMKQIKNILRKLPSPVRQRVVLWMQSVAMDPGEPAPPPPDPRQPELPGTEGPF